MRALGAVITILLSIQSVAADDKINGMSARQAMDRYDELYLTCRGEAGDTPKTQAACRQRDELGQVIKGYGWCYVGGWKKCAPAIMKKSNSSKHVMSNNWREKKIQIGAKQDCFLMSGTVSIVPLWRDNNVPLSKVHANIDSVLIQTGVSDVEKKEWHQLVSAIYSSRATSSEVEQELRPPCANMADGK